VEDYDAETTEVLVPEKPIKDFDEVIVSVDRLAAPRAIEKRIVVSFVARKSSFYFLLGN